MLKFSLYSPCSFAVKFIPSYLYLVKMEVFTHILSLTDILRKAINLYISITNPFVYIFIFSNIFSMDTSGFHMYVIK